MARFNRRVTNRLTAAFAPRMPGFGVILHTGRRSGRRYRTPVNVFTIASGCIVALTYGRESDWVQNVLAAGTCELEWRGRREHLRDPRIVHDPNASNVPAAARPVLRALRVADFLTLAASGG